MESSALLRGHTSELECAAWSPDGSLIATGAFDRTTRLWDPATQVDPREIVLQPHEDGGDYLQLDFHLASDAQSFATLSQERKEVELFDLAKGSGSRFSVHGGASGQSGIPTEINVFGHPAMILLGRSNGRLEIWDPRIEELVASWEVSSEAVRKIAISADGKRAALRTDSAFEIWDLEKRVLNQHLASSDEITSAIVFSPDGLLVAAGGRDQKVIVWDLDSGERSRELQIDLPDGVQSVAFSPDGASLAAGSADTNIIKVWRTDTWESQGELEGHIQGIPSIVFSPDGHTIASASADRSVTLWHLQTQQELLTLLFEGPVRKVEFTPDERYLIVSSLDLAGPMIRVWEIPTLAELAAWGK